MTDISNKNVTDRLENITKSKLSIFAENAGLKNYSISAESFLESGDNYGSELLSIKIKEESKKKELNLIYKSEKKDATSQAVNLWLAFGKEVYVYKNILPLYENFQKEKGISGTKGFFNYPKCYECDKGYIFLEDLRNKGYVMHDRFKDLNFDHLKLTIEALGKLHAVGFAFKNQHPEELQEHKQDLRDQYLGSDMFLDIFREQMTYASKTLEEDEEPLKKKMLRLKDNVSSEFRKFIGPEDAEPHAVINHGDCWNNNFLYKYKDGKPTDVCLIDFQMSRYCSPAVDLSCYIFCSTDQQIRERHYTDLLHAYHKSLSDMLKLLGCDASELFPCEVLESHMKRFGAYGVIVSCLMLQVKFCKGIYDTNARRATGAEGSDEISGDMTWNKSTYQRYKKQMSGVIRDASKYGMI